MNELVVFKNATFGEIRVEKLGNDPWFVAKDVCEKLGYSNSRKAVQDHVDNEDKRDDVRIRDTIGRMQKMTIINESGLYSLILSSKLSTAKLFKKWITNEVIPSIRKNGGYISGQEKLSEDELMAKALLVAQNKIAERDQKLKEAEPKILLANSVLVSKNSDIYVREMAKILKQAGYDTGEERLFEELRERGFLINRKGIDYNTPTQKAVDMGVIKLKRGTYTKPCGASFEYKTPLITARGQVYFLNLFINGGK